VKIKKEKYSFSKQEIEILKQIVTENLALSQIRERLSIKPNLLSHYIKDLQQKQIIRIGQELRSEENAVNSRKNVGYQDNKHSLMLKELLMRYSQVKWENVLSGLGLDVLFQIATGSDSLKESMSLVTFWRYSRNLMALGIVAYNDEKLQINDRFSLLKDFLDEYQAFIIRNLVASVSSNAVLLWQKDSECLIRVPKLAQIDRKGFVKTATSRLQDFGIQLTSDFDVYFYSKGKREIHLEDVILHMLLIEKENVRYNTYCLLLLKKYLSQIDENYLMNKAIWYDLNLQINAMLEFLKTKGIRTGQGLPTWNEFGAKMREYEIEAVA
jgi:hypothetical protein